MKNLKQITGKNSFRYYIYLIDSKMVKFMKVNEIGKEVAKENKTFIYY